MDSYGDGLDELPALRNVADKARTVVGRWSLFERHIELADLGPALAELREALQELDDTDA